MSESLIITSKKTGKKYKIKILKSYRVEQSIDIPADGFEFTMSNFNFEVSNAISPGDYVSFSIDGNTALIGYIDDLQLNYGDGNEISINGRDKMAALLDNDATPKTYYNIGLKEYLSKIMPKYNVKYNTSSIAKFKKIIVEQGENEYTIIERLAKDRNRVVYFDSNETLQCGNIISTKEPSYTFTSSSSVPGFRILNANIVISNDIKDEVVIYGEKTIEPEKGSKVKNPKTGRMVKSKSTKQKIKGYYTDKNLKTNKRRIINDSNVESFVDANKRAKEEFYDLNKDSFIVNIIIETSKPISINKCARVYIKEMGLDVHLYVDKVEYTKSMSDGTLTNITLKLMPGISASYKNNDIPTLPKLYTSVTGDNNKKSNSSYPGHSFKTGSRGEDVKKIQTKLEIKADGIYGKATHKTVMDFQRKNKLKVDGIVGENTWDKLF